MSADQLPKPDALTPDKTMRTTRPWLFVLIALGVLFVLGYSGRLLEKVRLDRELARWEQRILGAQARHLNLQEEAKLVNSLDVIDDIARVELGLAKEGDRIVVFIEPAPAEENTASATVVDPPQGAESSANVEPHWRSWVDLFTRDSEDAAPQ